MSAVLNGLVFGVVAACAWFLTGQVLWTIVRNTALGDRSRKKIVQEVVDEMRRTGGKP